MQLGADRPSCSRPPALPEKGNEESLQPIADDGNFGVALDDIVDQEALRFVSIDRELVAVHAQEHGRSRKVPLLRKVDVVRLLRDGCDQR